MIQKKMDYSTTNTASTRFVPQQNAQNLAKSVQKATLLLFLFFIMCASYAQNVTIVGNPAAYYCGQVITLQAPELTSNSFFWTSNGGVRFRPVGTTGAGTLSLFVLTGNTVEAIINGSATVTSACLSCLPSPTSATINLAPSPATLANLTYTSSTTINQANGIQTTKNWICVSNDGSTQTITVRNPSPLNIFWVVSGGAIKMGESQAVVGGLFTYTVTVATAGPTAGKGSIRAFVSDPCGTLTCDAALDWEILKNIMPDNISGPTCLRDNNVDPANPTVVYSIPDVVAGNAVYEWELYDKDNNLVDDTNPYFSIGSQVLYGNSATIAYKNGYFPSDAGNFSVKVINACGGEIIRQITVGPAKPSLTQTTYCVSAAIGTTETITLPALQPGQIYLPPTVQGGVNWNVLDVSSIAPNPPNTFEITFGDAANGSIEIKASSSTDPGCTSEGTSIFFNRDGGTTTITGPTCVTRGTNIPFSFSADEGRYEWSISPALPAGFTDPSTVSGNVLTITPNGIINISGTYTVTATLTGGCASSTPATFNFEIGPAKPTITGGSTCLASTTSANYTVTSAGAVNYVATVTPNGGSPIVSSSTAIGTPFSYTGTTQDATISFTAYSATGCASLPTVIEVKAKPVVTSITSTNSCVNFNETPTITYTAASSGTVTAFTWTAPAGWIPVLDTDATDNTATYILDNTTAGDVCVTPRNGTCVGDQFCLSIPRNALRVEVTRGLLNPSVGFITVKSPIAINTPLEIQIRYAASEEGVDDCGEGTSYPTTSTNSAPLTSETVYYLIGIPNYNWTGVRVLDPTNPDPECDNCFHFLTSNIVIGTTSNFKIKNDGIETNLDIKTYPNPVENMLNVKVPIRLRVQDISLFDAQGRIVFNTKESKNEQKIDVSKFAKGSYILLVVTDKGAETKKIIIE